jgi:hypothetical protein
MNVTGSTISGNEASGQGVSGGGIDNNGDTSTVTVVNSTISDNKAAANVSSSGGGISNFEGAITIINSTLSNNLSGSNGGAIGNAGTLNIIQSTITNNEARAFGGGINTSSGSATIANTIVADNALVSPGAGPNINGSVTEEGNNITSGDPLLGPLADNGGPTETHLPQSGSPAIDAGVNAEALDPDGNALTSDQRGYTPRIVNGTVDIGSVEVDASMPLGLWDINFPDGSPGSGFVLEGVNLPILEYELVINETVFETVTPNPGGNVAIALLTSPETSPGSYTVTLRPQTPEDQAPTVSTSYLLDPAAPLRAIPEDAPATPIEVPASVEPAAQQIYLPLIQR